MTRLFSKNLRFIRNKKGVSQQELADKLKLDRSTISRWENDEMDITVGNAIQISDYFNVPIELFTSSDLSNPNTTVDEFEVLFSKNKDILTDEDKETMRFLIEKRKREIDKQNNK